MHYCPHGITPSCQIQQHKTGKLFRGRSSVGVGLFIFDFFRYAPRFDVGNEKQPTLRPDTVRPAPIS